MKTTLKGKKEEEEVKTQKQKKLKKEGDVEDVRHATGNARFARKVGNVAKE